MTPLWCYHCNASHPGIKRITNLDRYYVIPTDGRFEHNPPNRDDVKPEDIQFLGNGAFTYNYPNTSVNFSIPYFFFMRVVPTGPTTVRTDYQVYRNPDSTLEHFDEAAEFFEGIKIENLYLMNGVQQSPNRGVFENGPLHSARESGVFAFKKLVQKNLVEHYDAEMKAGEEIWPARHNQQLNPRIIEEEKFPLNVCENCSCGTNAIT